MRVRREQWPQLLDQFIVSRAGVRFEWGAFDCAMFAADWVLLACGVDLAAAWRGKYSSAAGADALLRRDGGLDAMITGVLGEPIAVSFAQRGDVVVDDAALGLTAGVCVGGTAAFVSDHGLIFKPLAGCATAWRV